MVREPCIHVARLTDRDLLYRAGAFGVVSLVRERSTGQLFAMKQVIYGVHTAVIALE